MANPSIGRGPVWVVVTGWVAVIVAGPAKAQFLEPHIGWVYPAGGQQGTRVEVTLGGTGFDGASDVRISGRGVTATLDRLSPPVDARPKAKSGKAAEVNPDDQEPEWLANLTVTIGPEAELGRHDLRVVTPNGISNWCTFVVGQVPEVNELEPNSRIDQAQRLPALPVVVNGRILQADEDFFRFTAKAGQTLVCRVQARALMPYIADAVPGWVQSAIALYDAAGHNLAYVDDFRFDPDPLLVYTVERDGDYMLQIQDTLYRGREDFVYRLSIGETPFITDVYPLGVRAGTDTQVHLYGANLDQPTLTVSAAKDESGIRQVAILSKGLQSNAAALVVEDLPTFDEVESNDGPATANEVNLPVVINGRIQSPGDVDTFAFEGQTGQKVVAEVRARRLGSPVDSIVTVLNAKGTPLAENDDTVDRGAGLVTHQADSYLQVTLPASGRFLVQIRDVQGAGGPEYAYRLRIGPPQPGFDLFTTPDHLRGGQGGTVAVMVEAVRRDGFVGDIGLSVRDLPAGCTVSAAAISTGQDQARLTVTASPDVPMQILSPTVVGQATVEDKTLIRQATPAEELMQAFSTTHLVPSRDLLLMVTSPVLVQLVADLQAGQGLEIPQGGSIEVAVKALRKEAAKGPIVVAADAPPKGVTVKRTTIAKDQDQAKVTITAGPQVVVGFQQNLILIGTLKLGKQTVKAVVPAIPIRVVAAAKP